MRFRKIDHHTHEWSLDRGPRLTQNFMDLYVYLIPIKRSPRIFFCLSFSVQFCGNADGKFIHQHAVAECWRWKPKTTVLLKISSSSSSTTALIIRPSATLQSNLHDNIIFTHDDALLLFPTPYNCQTTAATHTPYRLSAQFLPSFRPIVAQFHQFPTTTGSIQSRCNHYSLNFKPLFHPFYTSSRKHTTQEKTRWRRRLVLCTWIFYKTLHKTSFSKQRDDTRRSQRRLKVLWLRHSSGVAFPSVGFLSWLVSWLLSWERTSGVYLASTGEQ